VRALAILLLSALLSTPALAASEQERILGLAQILRCPVCRSVSVADSPAELSGEMYAVIVEQVRAGRSDEEIIDYFVARYGEGVLLKPPARGLNLLVWAGPALILAAGGLVVFRVLRGWTSGSGRSPGADELDPDALARVRRETRAGDQ
jgi:cytochrome c-type biogenesis protein CcmH